MVVTCTLFHMAPLRDRDIRPYLTNYILSLNPRTWIRHEMGVNGCVADILTVTDIELHIYEIKSDVDTTHRLGDRTHYSKRWKKTWNRKGQVTAYSAMADAVTLVVGKELLEESVSKIPAWWGVILAESLPDGSVGLTPYRAGLPNPDLRWVNVFKFLWRAEALAVCERLGVAKGVRSSSKAKIKARLKEHMPLVEHLRWEVRRAIRTR